MRSEDEDSEIMDYRNNVITQAELFRSYSESNHLYTNCSA
jgi:hypothetical protein